MVGRAVSDRKQIYRKKLEQLLQDYQKILIVTADYVGSNQMQKIRILLRGKGVLLMGKNTMIRKVIREMIPSNPNLEKLLPYVYGNIGFVFTNDDAKKIRDVIQENKVPAAAKVGVIAPADVHVPSGPTGLDPGQTGFFQALNIATKIVKGAVEIVNDVHLIHKGSKVNPSHVSLLGKLNIKPFFYGSRVEYVYEGGSIFGVDVLNITADDLMQKFFSSLTTLTALSLRIGVPNVATLPHSLANAVRKLVAIAVTTDVTFKAAEPFKEYLADPAGWAAKHGGPVQQQAPAKADNKAAPAPAAKKEEPKEEEDDDMFGAGGLFD
jgi:large subunit ribosomal protein LP0